MAKKVEKKQKVEKKSTAKKVVKKPAKSKVTKKVETKNNKATKKPVHHKIETWKIVSAVLIIIILFLITAIGIRVHTGNVQFLPNTENNFEEQINERLENLNQNNEIYELVVIEDTSCKDCEVDKNINLIKENIFPELIVSKFDSQNVDAKQVLNELGLKILPVYFFSENIEKHTKFNSIQDQLVKIDLDSISFYLINPTLIQKKTLASIPEVSSGAVQFQKENSEPQLTIYELSDFSSPIPAMLNTENDLTKELQKTNTNYFPPIPKIFEKYVETGKVKYVKINFPYNSLYKNSKFAHNAALCANEQGKYQLFEKELYTKRTQWVDSDKAIEKFIEFGKLIQIENIPVFVDCVKTTKYSGQIEYEVNEFLDFGITEVPTFIIGNKILTKLNNYEKFEAVIEAELSN